MKIIVKNDVFNISKRIKHINRDYFVIFDENKKIFQILNNKEIITLPFKTLDERVLVFLINRQNKTNYEILNEIEEHNQKLDKENKNKIIKSSIDCAEKILRRS